MHMDNSGKTIVILDLICFDNILSLKTKKPHFFNNHKVADFYSQHNLKINHLIMAFIWCYCVQENRREYEKRVASIVEQSWLIFGDEAEAKEATKGD